MVLRLADIGHEAFLAQGFCKAMMDNFYEFVNVIQKE